MIAMTAPSAPPADTPMIPGSAIGLRKSPCITAPETPRAAPTTNASNMRGNLIVVMMARSTSEAVVSANPRCSSKMPMVRDGGMVKGPTAAATITSTIPATARTADPRPSFTKTGVLLNSETARSHPAR